MDDFYDRQKQMHGTGAMFLWIIAGVYLFWTNEAASFLSWQALVFFIVGMFAAALVFGMLAYGAQRIVASLFMTVTDEPGGLTGALISSTGLVLFVAECVLVFVAARMTMEALF